MKVNVNKSSSFIEYDDENTAWCADAIFNAENKEVIILGTSRKLTDVERSNIITAILNKYYFRKLSKS